MNQDGVQQKPARVTSIEMVDVASLFVAGEVTQLYAFTFRDKDSGRGIESISQCIC